MHRTALRRAGLVVAPLLLAAAGTVATATPAAADCTNVVSCSSRNDNGNLHAGVSYITVSVDGGHYASKSAMVEVPNQVPPPCWYTKGRTGAELYADSKDPYYYRVAHGVGENHDDWFPPEEVAAHKDDDGNWYSHVSLLGRVVELRRDPHLADIDRLAVHYTGRPYGDRGRDSWTAIVQVERWHGWGPIVAQ